MFEGSLGAVVFGLASALSWGAGDFSGGMASKRAPLLGVILLGHAVGLVLLIGLALLWAEQIPASADMAWGAAAGLAGVLGIAALYRGLAVGRMGLVAPVSAVLTAAIPVVFGTLIEGLPGVLKLAGFALALVGVWLIAGAGEDAHGRDGLGLALLAGGGFGLFFILIHRAGASATFWPLAAARSASVLLILAMVLARRNSIWAPPRRALPLVLLSGMLDVGGNAFLVLAGQAGRLDVAAILSSLYPASTVLLATLLLGERVSRVQAAGIAAVLAAIALIAS